MKRFWKAAAPHAVEQGWIVHLDGRPIRTQRGLPQVVPNRRLAEAMAGEWRAQGEDIDPAGFRFRDLADYAIDIVAPDRGAAVARLLAFAESDTLCYRAEPDEPLAARQRAVWEPLLKDVECGHGVRFERVAGIVHRRQPEATLAALQAHLETLDDFTLAALQTLAGVAASLSVGLAALRPGAEPEALFAAGNLEEDWQAELWGWDHEAEARRARRLAEFTAAARFAELARG
jgi:chaperone required for assembly of F1-ATPase